MVLFVYGNVTLREVERMAVRLCKSETGDESFNIRQAPDSQFTNFNYSLKKDTHQAHVVVGCRTYPMGDTRYVGLYLLNNILGGPGMNSRLNMALRERRGLVYTVESSLTGYTDTSVWTAYLGCDHADIERCRRLVAVELNRLLDRPLSESQLTAAKRQLQGQAALSWENGENVAIGMGRRMLHLGQTQTLEQFCQQIEGLTSQQLWDIARETFDPASLATLVYTQ